jgi:hypothetical protein
LINFSTRGDARLDLCLTDISEYEPCKKLSPLATNDHCGVVLEKCCAPTALYTRVKRRLWNKSNKNEVLCDVIKEDWSEVFYSRMNAIINKHAPLKTFKTEQGINKSSALIRKLSKAKDKAYKAGSPVWKSISKYLKLTIKKQQKVAADINVNHNTDAKSWWKEIKHLTTPHI